MYGTQTMINLSLTHQVFENDVKMYGTQTVGDSVCGDKQFENDVKMYGTQTVFVLKLIVI